MSESVYWILEVDLKEGQLDAFRALMGEMVSRTEANEPGTLEYEWHLSEDETCCHISERYRDSEATMVHLKSFGENFADRFMSCVEPTRFVIYGKPSEDVKTALAGFGATFMRPWGGFTR